MTFPKMSNVIVEESERLACVQDDPRNFVKDELM